MDTIHSLGAADRFWRGPAGRYDRGTALLYRWRNRVVQRRHLALLALNRHLLRDLGLEPEAALAEAAKPFWRP